MLSNFSFQNYTTICSRLKISGETKHLPLLDFHIPISEQNQHICEQLLRELKLSGYLLNSGKSYHFIGNTLLSEVQLIEKLYYALLLSPMIDRAWIAHQLIQKYCCLRVSKKYDRLPILISYID